MTSLPYKTEEAGDPANIPLDSLHIPRTVQRSDSAASEYAQRPPPHFAHAPRENDPNFFQGMDVGNQAGYGDNFHQPSPSGSGSSGPPKPATWDQHDTLVDRGRRPEKIDGLPLHHDVFEKPHASFAGGDRRSRANSVISSADESEDFDWDTSGDEEQEDNKATAITRARRGRKFYLVCLRLARPVRIFLAGLIGTAIFLIPFIVVTTSYQDSSARGQVVVWSIWLAIIWAASCGTFVLVNWIPPVALRVVIAVYGKAPEVVKTNIEAFMASTFYISLVLCVVWSWISLGGVLAIQYSSTNRPPYFRWIFYVIKSLFATSVILLVEKIALQFVAINFHKTAVKDRLEQNQQALKALDKLHDSKYLQQRRRFNPMRSRPASPGYKQAYDGQRKQSRDGLGGYFPPADNSEEARVNAEKESHNRHFPSMHLHHHTDGTNSPSDHEKRKTFRKANLAAQISEAVAMATLKDSKLYKGTQLGSQRSARKLAKLLFTNLADNKSALVAEDFIPYFKTEDEARQAFALFDADKNGDISKEEMREAVQRIYRERRALSTSLKDMSSAISKLDGVLMFIGLIVVIFIWLLIFNGDSTVANIVPLSTFVVGFSFIFGNSAKAIFESMIFIFATHPYDVGDLVCIDEEWMFVKEFGLLSTTFRTVINQEVVAPNALLATSKYIYNSRRSGAQWEYTLIQLSFDTSLETIEKLRTRLRAWTKENDREFGGPLEVNFNSISQQNAVELIVAFEHKGNWQDWGARWNRRTKLMRQIKSISEDLGIVYQLPPQPITFQPKSGAAPFRLRTSATRQPQQSAQPQTPSQHHRPAGPFERM